MGFVMTVFYLPVFYGLQITSSYEVSEEQFSFKSCSIFMTSVAKHFMH